VCDSCRAALVQRDDDRDEVVRERLRVYREHTAPLLALYRDRGNLREVNGSCGPDEVFESLREVMGRVRR